MTHESDQRKQSDVSWVTTLFIQLSKITTVPEPMPDNDSEYLRDYHQAIERTLTTYGGLRVAGSDDTVLALFKGSGRGDDASDAVQTAIELFDELSKVNRQRMARNEAPLRIGIGLDTLCVAPTDLERYSQVWSTLRRPIVQARGLSRLNQQSPFPAVFVSRSTYQGMRRRNGYTIQNLGDAFIPDQNEPVTVYAIMQRQPLTPFA
jgi:class 3 adenylate cyclase